MKRYLGLIGIVAALIVLTTVSCTKRGREQTEELGLSVSETFRINIVTEPPTLDWQKIADTTSANVVKNLMDGLTTYNTQDPELGLSPGLALSWEPSEKGKVWTFKLRPGVKWSDGKELTAQQFVDGWERLLNPMTGAEYAYSLFAVKNAEEYNKKQISDFSQVGVKAVDPLTLRVELKSPLAFFPLLVAHHSTFPIRKELIEKYRERWTEAGNLVSLGAFTLKAWEHDKHLVMERNDNFFGDKAKVKYVICRMINEMSTGLNLFDAGRLDMLEQLPSQELSKLRTRPEYKEVGLLGIYAYAFNVKRAPFDNINFRKAIIHAVNHAEITTLLGGGQIPIRGWVPPGMFGYDDSIGLKFDATKAKEYLKKSGYGDGGKPIPKITLAFNTNEDHKRIAENIQAQLKKNIGVNIELSNQEWKVFLDSLKVDAPQLHRMGWIADYPDPDNFATLMTSGSDNNHTKWKSEKYDKLVTQGATELDKEKRRAIYTEAQKLLVEEEAPVLPIYSYVDHYMISTRVKNFPANPLQRWDFNRIELVQPQQGQK